MDGAGWVSARVLLEAGIREGWVRDEVEFRDAVESGERLRFEFSPDSWNEDDAFDWRVARVRACSGHTIVLDLGLAPYEPEGDLFYGTGDKHLDRILRDGLVSGTRKQTRLVAEESHAAAIAASRGGEPAVFRVDAVAMAREGHVFHLAGNGEILTATVPVRHISLVGPRQAARP